MSVYDPIPGQTVFGAALPSYDELQGCIRCGRCLPVCPTYQQTQLEIFSPRGRLSLLRAVEDGKLDLTARVEQHLYHCLDCRACNTVCPPGVRIGELILRGRVAAEERHPRSLLIRFFLRNILVGARRAEILSAPLRFVQALRLDRLAVLLLGRLPGIGTRIRDLLLFAPRIGKPVRRELAFITPAQGERRHRVAFFLGCMMNVAMPDVSRATLRVLTRAGCEVITPDSQRCCGAPQDDQAMPDLAREMARHNIALFESLPGDVEAIVTDCAGCSGALKEYAEWLHGDPAWSVRARSFSARVRDVTEWLDAIWPPELGLRHTPARATYHDPCHLANVQGVRKAPRNLLARIQGLETAPLADSFPVRCCGSAGIYNVTHQPMSTRLLEAKMDDIAATGADLIVSANPGCLMQLEWGQKRAHSEVRVRHIVQVL
ncbi:MAG TPA: (Fe-S)-binding protein, partial [Acidobacteriota bacterium]|nr:(Fe-S)-binding protein [Acidobacteriota bacterium]